ncbi:MAG: FHA domain-containing protein [Methylacidiphilales bacterium]|nr:FHA domain-containing protein [Candidatus Methylacidiphilales bacterium]
MHLTKGLFSAEEAFVRLGQLRETGCLVVISDKEPSRIFTRDACVVNAYSGNREGQAVLDTCFDDIEASYVWIPGAKPPREMINININSHALKAAIAKDIHLSKTAKVKLDSVDQSTIPQRKKPIRYYMVAKDKPDAKISLNKGTVIIGRDESCDMIIANPRVSRRHCLLQLIVRGLSFRDLESSNGIFINGIRAKDGFVQSGDKLSLGSYELVVHRET